MGSAAETITETLAHLPSGVGMLAGTFVSSISQH